MKRNFGFSLIEVLVTLVLTTIGILGVVAMQSRAIQQTQDSVQRNTAVMLVNELVEIMRINPAELFENTPPKTPLYNKLKSSSVFYKVKGSDFASIQTCSNPANAKTAQQQLDCWAAQVQKSLPQAADTFRSHSYICPSSTSGSCDGGSTLEVQLAWKVKDGTCLDSDGRAPDVTTCIYRTRVEL
ncbi:type IV pilus modification protein PilV [Halopseudomonas pelagia]|uniref:type IV pilus modification protein PilV n=1 Tax=Halopseudomonas pelagia TaxID=553151 RepID=UPI0030DBB919|tara:strand:+ start:1052 stop:1606 length:555 start_codon:yes stop_codon:yes gene_type:complete